MDEPGGMTAVLERPPQVESAPRSRPRSAGFLSSGWTKGAGLGLAVVVLVLVALASIALGSKPIPFATVWDGLWHYDPSNNDHIIIRELRIPRTLLGVLVGASLAAAGALMQGVTRNPLADPGILGIEAGASLAVVIAIRVFSVGTLTGYAWFAFVGAGLASVVVYGLGSLGRGGATPVKLALAGAAMTSLLASFTTAVLLLDVATLDEFRFWVVGSLAGRDMEVVRQVTPFLVVGFLVGAVFTRALNTLALGDDMARALGQRVGQSRFWASIAVILLCGAATAACGPIAFVGLTIPHVARAICGPDYRWIYAWSLALGGILLLGADVVGRVVARPGEVQVGIMTAVLGAPFFIALVRRRKLAEL